MNRAFVNGLGLAPASPALPGLIACAAAIRLDSRGPVLQISQRVGHDNALFDVAKFRTMRVGSPQSASHLLTHLSTRAHRPVPEPVQPE